MGLTAADRGVWQGGAGAGVPQGEAIAPTDSVPKRYEGLGVGEVLQRHAACSTLTVAVNQRPDGKSERRLTNPRDRAGLAAPGESCPRFRLEAVGALTSETSGRTCAQCALAAPRIWWLGGRPASAVELGQAPWRQLGARVHPACNGAIACSGARTPRCCPGAWLPRSRWRAGAQQRQPAPGV